MSENNKLNITQPMYTVLAPDGTMVRTSNGWLHNEAYRTRFWKALGTAKRARTNAINNFAYRGRDGAPVIIKITAIEYEVVEDERNCIILYDGQTRTMVREEKPKKKRK